VGLQIYNYDWGQGLKDGEIIDPKSGTVTTVQNGNVVKVVQYQTGTTPVQVDIVGSQQKLDTMVSEIEQYESVEPGITDTFATSLQKLKQVAPSTAFTGDLTPVDVEKKIIATTLQGQIETKVRVQAGKEFQDDPLSPRIDGWNIDPLGKISYSPYRLSDNLADGIMKLTGTLGSRIYFQASSGSSNDITQKYGVYSNLTGSIDSLLNSKGATQFGYESYATSSQLGTKFAVSSFIEANSDGNWVGFKIKPVGLESGEYSNLEFRYREIATRPASTASADYQVYLLGKILKGESQSFTTQDMESLRNFMASTVTSSVNTLQQDASADLQTTLQQFNQTTSTDLGSFFQHHFDFAPEATRQLRLNAATLALNILNQSVNLQRLDLTNVPVSFSQALVNKYLQERGSTG